jgi:hypothetical protein
MSVTILAHKLNRYIGNCNDSIAQKNNFANNNNMLNAKVLLWCMWKLATPETLTIMNREGVWILELINIQKQKNNFQQIDTY